MTKENEQNRDAFFKFCFMYFLIHILKVLGIDEEIKEVLPTEMISFKLEKRPKLFDNFFDFRVLTESGKILIFEFKKDTLRKTDLQQAYNYYDRVHCKKNESVELILIVISKFGKIMEYKDSQVTFRPKIIKTKKENKQKDLNDIRYKFENNKRLTLDECSLLIALPLFELDVSEAEVVEEVCGYLGDKEDLIPDEVSDEITVAMYLNIIEYIDGKVEQDRLLEMINMDEKYEGLIAQIRNDGERNIISRLLKKHSIGEVASLLDMGEGEIEKIIKG
jgi:hypothetical protein